MGVAAAWHLIDQCPGLCPVAVAVSTRAARWKRSRMPVSLEQCSNMAAAAAFLCTRTCALDLAIHGMRGKRHTPAPAEADALLSDKNTHVSSIERIETIMVCLECCDLIHTLVLLSEEPRSESVSTDYQRFSSTEADRRHVAVFALDHPEKRPLAVTESSVGS